MINGEDLVKYIINSFGKISNTQLQKIVYLTELEYMKRHGERLTNFKYVKYRYGPYSPDILNIQNKDQNIIKFNVEDSVYPAIMSMLTIGTEIKIPSDLKKEIDTIINQFKGKNASELATIAKNTEIYKDAEENNEELDMDGYAEYYKSLLSDEFWENIAKKDEENEKNGIYGKKIIKDVSELKSIFS